MMWKRLEEVIHKAMLDFELPGVVVGVVKDGDVVYAVGFGLKDLRGNDPITSDSLFHMASISKTFVSTAVMQLVEQGKVDLEAPFADYLPYFRLQGEGWQRITVAQMLSHTSGVPDTYDYAWDRPQWDEGALERYVRTIAGMQPLFAPGEKFSYSNIAYEALGDLIAKVSGIPFEIYIQKNLLGPIGMKKSTFLRSEVDLSLATSPHVWALEPRYSPLYPYNREHAPSSTLHSSALEMCHWAQVHLAQGTLEGTCILGNAAHSKMWTPRMAEQSERAPLVQAVGLGWFLGEHGGQRIVSHGGSDVGYNTMFMLAPEARVGVTVLCNLNPAPNMDLALAAMDAALGFEPQPIKQPLIRRIGKVLLQEGLAVACKEQENLLSRGAAEIDLQEASYMDVAEGLAETGKAGLAQDVLYLCEQIYGETADSIELRTIIEKLTTVKHE